MNEESVAHQLKILQFNEHAKQFDERSKLFDERTKQFQEEEVQGTFARGVVETERK